MDFLLVVTSKEHQSDQAKDIVFRLDDSCAHCSRPIRMEVRNGAITLLEPATVWVQQGGG